MRNLRLKSGKNGAVLVAASVVLAVHAIHPAHGQESAASIGAASSMSSSMSNMGGSMSPGSAMQGMEGQGMGGAGTTTSQTTTSTTIVQPPAFRSSRSSGADFLNELMAAPKGPRAIPETRRRSPRAQAAYARRVSRMSRAQRSRLVSSKYKKPSVGWMAYYLPQDRFKVTSSNWRYVSIEDDTRDYPVRYYYRPSSQAMLNVLRNSPRGLPRYNRVIGFHTWQDAMIAGYRPDPVSRPEPAAQVAQLARVARGPRLERYVEFLYAGQISPRAFSATYSYLRQVETAVSRRADTRPLVGQTVRQALAAVMGDGPPPRSVGGTAPKATAVATVPASGSPSRASGPPPGAIPPATVPPSSTPGQPLSMSESSGGDKRTEDFEKFSNRAGNLSRR